VLVNRSGAVEHVIVGDAHKLMLPDVGRLRAARRAVSRAAPRAHAPARRALTHDDLVDLTRLRLDLVAAIHAKPDGTVGDVLLGAPAPREPRGQALARGGPRLRHRVMDTDFLAMIRARGGGVHPHLPLAQGGGQHDGRAVLVHVTDKRRAHFIEDSLRELRELARTAGVVVVDEVVQVREQVDPRFVLGKGKLDEVMLRACSATPTC
jgi:GTP-binding protein HflX